MADASRANKRAKGQPEDGEQEERPQNVWEVYGSNHSGPRLKGELRDIIAGLLVTKAQVQREDQHLLTMTHAVHDDHRQGAEGLGREIEAHGVGTHPPLEDMYGQHLRDANQADALVGQLERRTRRNGPETEDTA